VQLHKYEVHGRFGHLRAGAIPPRLQLAALYAAATTPVPEPGSRATGAQTALQLLRQCWTNQPLAVEDLEQLRSVPRLGGHLAPGLHLLAHELELSAAQLAYYQRREGAPGLPVLDTDAETAYVQRAGRVLPGGWGLSFRERLTASEEQRVMGVGSTRRAATVTPAWRRLGHYSAVDASLPECPVPAGLVQEAEQKLVALVVQPGARSLADVLSGCGTDKGGVPLYPLAPAASNGGSEQAMWLDAEMHRDLQASWEAYHSTPTPTEVLPSALGAIKGLQVGDWGRTRCC
jgi:hypothetical protein